MNNYDYPIGSDTEEAPWNQKENKPKEIEVLISITLSKNIKIKVTDYEVSDSNIDEDGEYSEDIDYSNCDLETAVKEQVVLPHEAFKFIAAKKAVKDLKDWNVDEMEVIKE